TIATDTKGAMIGVQDVKNGPVKMIPKTAIKAYTNANDLNENKDFTNTDQLIILAWYKSLDEDTQIDLTIKVKEHYGVNASHAALTSYDPYTPGEFIERIYDDPILVDDIKIMLKQTTDLFDNVKENASGGATSSGTIGMIPKALGT